MLLLSPENFADYELIDCGSFEKLERFGDCITIRPEPQAVWDKGMAEQRWNSLAHVRFVARSSSSGTWQKLKPIPDRWIISYPLQEKTTLRFRLALTSFKHVGLFPEQAVNWNYIFKSIRSFQNPQPTVLNLFAYTGASSLAARAAGADVVHLDSVKQVVTWARENMELSHQQNIRWVVEDALLFVKREVKRGKKYNGIILDPPAYGHGTDGHKWRLEEMISEMIKLVLQLLDPREHFLLLNTYSLGFSSLIIENLFKEIRSLETGELFLKSKQGHKLPLGVFGRFSSPGK